MGLLEFKLIPQGDAPEEKISLDSDASGKSRMIGERWYYFFRDFAGDSVMGICATGLGLTIVDGKPPTKLLE